MSSGHLPRALDESGPLRGRFSSRLSPRLGPPALAIARDRHHLFASRSEPRRSKAALYESRLPGSGVKVYLIDQPRYFDRDGLYGDERH